MSVSAASKNEKAKTREQEIELLQAALDDALLAYTLLHDACIATMRCRNIVLREGTQRTINKVFECLDQAMEAAELVSPWPLGDTEMDGCIYCSVCERFFGLESEKAGRCLYCEAMGINIP